MCSSTVFAVRADKRRLVERHWNGNFGRLARRDIWLWEQDGRWTVEICVGGIDSGRLSEWSYDAESQARAMLRRCLETGGDGWRELPTGRL